MVDVSQSVRQLWLSISLAMMIVSAWRLCLDEGEAMKKKPQFLRYLFFGRGVDGWEYDVGWG